MNLVRIFEKVNLVMPMEQRRFFNYVDDTVAELMAMYDGFVFAKEGKKAKYVPPLSLDDEFNVLPLYHIAIVDNILFLAGAGDTYKSEFIRKSKEAYLKYWNDNAKGRRIKKKRWW
jgi:hypothetical protein